MSTNRGIFETFPGQQAARQDSPFAVVHEPVVEQAVAASPFAAVARQASPFTVVDDAPETKPVDFGKPVKIPERRKVDSPFQVAEPTEGFGYDAPSAPAPASFSPSPFEAAPAVPAASPFSVAPQAAPVASPFTVTPAAPAPQAAVQQAVPAFAQWQEPAPQAAPQAAPQPAVIAPQPEPAPPAAVPSFFNTAQPAPAPAVQHGDSQSDSFNIRQLELRAIFGVDREMSGDEILQRSRALPGMRNIARVGAQDMATLEALKNLLPSLGFGSGALKLYSGPVPLEFIREGQVMLAVQTDGGFAPGVRETLMIVARELGRLG